MVNLQRYVKHYDEKRGQASHSIERWKTRWIVYGLAVSLGCTA
jgi:hypothetical protein